VRRGFDFLEQTQAYSELQVFVLSVLPGTAFRAEARELGLVFQPRPPYYALRTPTLGTEQIAELLDEAQERFGIEFDPAPLPALEEGMWGPEIEAPDAPSCASEAVGRWRIDLDRPPCRLPPPECRAQVFTLWLRSAAFAACQAAAAELVAGLLADNPHTTLHVVLEPTAGAERLPDDVLPALQAACFRSTSYLDRYYSLCFEPGGAKRLLVLLPSAERERLGADWAARVAPYATLLWRGAAAEA